MPFFRRENEVKSFHQSHALAAIRWSTRLRGAWRAAWTKAEGIKAALALLYSAKSYSVWKSLLEMWWLREPRIQKGTKQQETDLEASISIMHVVHAEFFCNCKSALAKSTFQGGRRRPAGSSAHVHARMSKNNLLWKYCHVFCPRFASHMCVGVKYTVNLHGILACFPATRNSVRIRHKVLSLLLFRPHLVYDIGVYYFVARKGKQSSTRFRSCGLILITYGHALWHESFYFLSLVSVRLKQTWCKLARTWAHSLS